MTDTQTTALITQYRDIHARLDRDGLSSSRARTLSRRLDSLARQTRIFDPDGRTVGQILGWDRRGPSLIG